MSAGHRLSLPEGGGLKRQVVEQELKMAGQFFSLLSNVMKTCNDLDATEQKFIVQVQQLWNQDFAEVIRQVKNGGKLLPPFRARLHIAHRPQGT